MAKPIPKEPVLFNLVVDLEYLQVIGDALMQAPYIKAAPVINSINEQIFVQNQKRQQEAEAKATSGIVLTPGA